MTVKPLPNISATLSEVIRVFSNSTTKSLKAGEEEKGNCLPVYTLLPADVLTPVLAFLRITNGAKEENCFLLESAVNGEGSGRWSFLGVKPQKIIKTGSNQDVNGDPLLVLEEELSNYRYIRVPDAPPLTGGAIGFVSYDSIQYFEPKTACKLNDPLGIPDAIFMFCDTLLAFDHLFQRIMVISHVLPVDVQSEQSISDSYNVALAKISGLVSLLLSPDTVQFPEQPKIVRPPEEAISNVGKAGYENFVTKLKERIVDGEIIQAVPSQRLERKTALHPFNVYRHLRSLNPSPYMFYVDCGDGLRLVGASPECLCKVEKNVVTNHAIAGTIKRGRTVQEDESNAAMLLASLKDRAEHVMLVDLARNDVNRVCQPETVKVDSLMQVEKFSHVMHLTSQVSGKLREGLTRFDALRSIFPAGTVSGAPKIRAIQLISGLEQEKRGVYAGAVGHFNFDSESMDTCIAIRTMVFKPGVVYLQAGGGIVFDSNEEEEYEETINKLGANVRCVEECEVFYANQQLTKLNPWY